MKYQFMVIGLIIVLIGIMVLASLIPTAGNDNNIPQSRDPQFFETQTTSVATPWESPVPETNQGEPAPYSVPNPATTAPAATLTVGP